MGDIPERVQISTDRLEYMGLIGAGGLGLPMAVEVEIVEVKIEVTDSAKLAIEKSMSDDGDGSVLVISAESGGCSGYLYDMKIVDRPVEEGYQSISVGERSIMIHDRDSDLLNGIVLDYKDTLMGGGFQITNPNADRSCGCGQSFG
ncbi:MAG: iron-sulfur cluster assembly accessory protein [Euryarchaeota archaeon]|nr:iron-sulfur cluster assembly accessory protein [Euryarchaeota archaeon]RPG72211.1 MAG: iron-sulfur cluster assembly accessory protein [Euryarchaeota archaeon TMED192]|tara:strand:- start:2939 stop:3376 length:438 start_codon:yes stop_codon:yes gene_type:complete